MTAVSIVDDLDRATGRTAAGRPRWFAPLICALIAFCFILASTDLNARENWNSFDEGIVDNLTERVEGGNLQRQVGFLMMGALGAYLCFRPTTRRFSFDARLLFPLALFVTWIVISVLWSTDRSLSLKRQVLFWCVAVTVVGFWRQFAARDLALLALIGSGATTLFGIAYELIAGSVPAGEHGVYRFCGTMHPNHQGINAVIMMLAAMTYFDRTRLKRYAALTLAALFIAYLTKSRTALIAGLAAGTLYAVLRLPWRTTVTLGIALASVAGLNFVLNSAGLMPGPLDLLQMGRTDSDATTLTGRTEIWGLIFGLLNEDPTRWITGYGYQSFWSPERTRYISEHIYFHISEGHSAYFDTLLETGLIGVGLYVCLLYGSLAKWSWLSASRDRASLAFLASVLAFAAVHGLTESATIAPYFPTFFSYAAIAAAALHPPGRTPAAPRRGRVARASDREPSEVTS